MLDIVNVRQPGRPYVFSHGREYVGQLIIMGGKQTRHRQMEKVIVKLRGHFAYYGVTDNTMGIMRFAEDVRKLLFKWLNRRGKRGCMSWEKFMLLLKKFPLSKRLITVNLFTVKYDCEEPCA